MDKKEIKHFNTKILITIILPLITSILIIIKTDGDGIILSIGVGFALVNLLLLVFGLVE